MNNFVAASMKFIHPRLIAAAICILTSIATPASALDLNSFRAQHGRPALSMSSSLAGIA
jgi:hypothetical protein